MGLNWLGPSQAVLDLEKSIFSSDFVTRFLSEFAPPNRDIPLTEAEGAKTIGTVVAIISGVVAIAIIIIDIPALYRDISTGIHNLSNTKENFSKWRQNAVVTPVSSEQSQMEEAVVNLSPGENIVDDDLHFSDDGTSLSSLSLPSTSELNELRS